MTAYQAHRDINGRVIDCEGECGSPRTRGVVFTETLSYSDGSTGNVEIVAMLCADCEPDWLARQEVTA